MSTYVGSTPPVQSPVVLSPPVRELQAGDRLTRAEFERRYAATPHVKKAELIEGIVYMPSPVSQKNHGKPNADLTCWLATYAAYTPGVEPGDNSTVLLDLDNEPQPDAILRILPSHGGQSQDDRTYISGAPELAAEVTASTASYDLHDKLRAYRRNGVREYLVWRVLDREFDWFVLREGQFEALAARDGLLRSEAFPGLWLAAPALLAGDIAQVLSVLQQGLASPEHAAFMSALVEAGRGN